MKYLFIILLLIPFTVAHENSTDIGLYQALPSSVYCDVSYDHIFKVQNHHYKDFSLKTNVNVSYSFLNSSSFFIKTINSYSRSDTGLFLADCAFVPHGSVVLVCGNLTSFFLTDGSILVDENLDNNHLCFNVSVFNPSFSSCNASLSFWLDHLILNESKQKLHFNLSETSYPFTIEYWVENMWGDVVKKPLNTSNLNTKTYTPKIIDGSFVEGYTAFARLSFIACNNSLSSPLLSYPFIAYTRPPVNSYFQLSTRKDTYKEKEKIRIRLQGYKSDSTKNAIFLKLYDQKNKFLGEQTFYATKKYGFFDFEFSYKVPPCSNISKIYISATGLDLSSKHKFNVISDCKKISSPIVVEEEAHDNLSILSFYTLQQKFSDEIHLFYRVSGTGLIHFRLYALDDGYERSFSFLVNGTQKLNISLPLTTLENESKSSEVTRHYILTAFRKDGSYDFSPLTTILEHDVIAPAVSFNTVIAQNTSLNISSQSFPTGYTTGVLYEDKGSRSVHYVLGFLLVAQAAFGAWIMKSDGRRP